MHIQQLRTYRANQTDGRILVDGVFKGATLEDVGRPKGIKIPKETCIPEGEYFAIITHSARFGRPMIQLCTDQQSLICGHDNIVFTGIRVHRGTKTEHTEGCVLYMGDLPELEALVKANQPVRWTIGRE